MSDEESSFEYKRVGQHLIRRPRAVERWQVLVDVRGSARWITCSARLSRRFERAASSEELNADRAAGRMVRACVANRPVTDPASPNPSVRTRLRVRALTWRLSPPLAFGGPRRVGTAAARAAQELAERDLRRHRGSAERIEGEAQAGWAQNRERLAGVEQRAAYFLGGAGLGAGVLLASTSLLVDSDARPEGVARIVAAIGLLITILGLVASAAYALAATMQTFGRITPDITSQVIERAKRPDEQARMERAARLIASRRRSSYIANWKVARLTRAAIASACAVLGLLIMLTAVLVTI
ncbi:MAG TPA: hypothetical protein VF517_04835 [Thermoleophilaceae bacterium]|jgi:hypothetical protein